MLLLIKFIQDKVAMLITMHELVTQRNVMASVCFYEAAQLSSSVSSLTQILFYRPTL